MELFLCILFSLIGLLCYIWYVLKEAKKEKENESNQQ